MDSFGHFDGGPGGGEWIPDRDFVPTSTIGFSVKLDDPVEIKKDLHTGSISGDEICRVNLVYLKAALKKAGL